ncbi:MAG: superoxide dismutase [Planctomycetes bacterium]|nr:superoxide dismutase [Planctomycetota bacterium]
MTHPRYPGRRQFLKTSGMVAASAAFPSLVVGCAPEEKSAPADDAPRAGGAGTPTGVAVGTMAPAPAAAAATFQPVTLPALDYPYDALEPHIDARTMEIHHQKHHQAYVDGLNKALAGRADLPAASLDGLLGAVATVPEEVRTALRNHGGGHFNHSMFWSQMAKAPRPAPSGALEEAMRRDFGGFKPFQEKFTDAAMKRFGSGWSWLALAGGRLVVFSTANQDNPLMGEAAAGWAGTPLLGLDVWEHAYYLKYQNRRAEYVAAWWNVVNWEEVVHRHEAALTAGR